MRYPRDTARCARAAAGTPVRHPVPSHMTQDLRLLLPAAATWLAAAVMAGRSPQTTIAVALACIVTAVGGRHRRLTAAALLCAAAACVAVGMRTAARAAGPLADLAAERAEVRAELVLTGDPVELRSRVVGAQRLPGGVRVPARVEAITIGARRTSMRHPVTVVVDAPGGWRGRLPGERVEVEARLAPPRDSEEGVAVVRAHGSPRSLAGPSWLARAAGRVRAGLHDAARVLPESERGLLPGIVLGDTSRLDPGVREDFRRTGLTHLVAVSGANVAVVLAAALLVARRLRAGPRGALVVAALALLAFVGLARPSPSVLRAGVMGGLALVAVGTDRERAGLPLLSSAVLLLLLLDPALATSAGFALSVSATLGLLVLAPGWRAALAQRWPGWLADAVAVPLAAQAACAPVLAALFGTVSLVAIPANLLALPAVGLATIAGVLAAMLAPVCLPLAQVAAWLAGLPTAWLVAVAGYAARVPAGQLGWPRGWFGAVLVLGMLPVVIAAVREDVSRHVASATALGLLLAVTGVRVIAPGWPPAGWVLVACDVGQGDALVVRAGGVVVVVDAGPDPAVMDRCLRDLRIRRVAAVVLTHLHADHVEGLPGVLRGRRVGEVVVGPLDEPAEEWQRVQEWAGRHRVPLRRATLGERWTAGAGRYDVLGPAAAFHGTESDPNNSSLVLRAHIGALTVLLTGDVEQPAQQALLDAGTPLRADFLKVPHHGSDRQLPDFLAAVAATAAVTSVGRDNPYGHPAPRTVERLAAAGLRAWRTDQDGDVAVALVDGRLVVSGRRGTGTPPHRALAFSPSRAGLYCPVRSPVSRERAILLR